MKLKKFLPLLGLTVLLVFGVVAGFSYAEAEKPTVTVYKTATCGCCSKWVTHLEENGFTVEAKDVQNLRAIKNQYGVPGDLSSCHTAVVEGYVVEGHVPADLVSRMLAERSDIAGIAVPGMPIGSPGMEGPNPQSYEVIAFDKEGGREVFARR